MIRDPVARDRRSTLALLTGSSAVQMSSNMAAALLAASVLGPHGRGLMVLGVSTAGIVPLLAGLGTGPQLRSALPAAGGTRRRDLVASYTWWSAAATAGAAVLAVAVSTMSAPLIDPALADPRYLLALALLTCGYVAHTQLPDGWYAAGLFRAGSLWAMATTLGGGLGLLVAVLVAPDVWSLLLGQGAGMLAATTAQVVALRDAGLLCFQAPTRGQLSRLLGQGCRALGLTLGLALALRLDRYVLGALTGAAAVGVYSVASTLGQVPRMVPNAIGQLVNRDAAIASGPLRPARTVAVTAVAVTAVGAVTGLVGWLVIIPLLGAEFADAGPLLAVLLVAEIAFVPYAVASRALLGAGRMGAVGLFGLAWSAVALALFLLAVQLWGAVGAAVTCVTLYAGISASSWLLLIRRISPDQGPDGPLSEASVDARQGGVDDPRSQPATPLSRV
ncbi:oligosaccharide flippase family protein [Solwaraspora sp. WMMD406]|uniref:lipopolysaccharide biosynthesis protein n=1 Tax=Solwaraspora sp. WMMD406 TaxID=3016095 RepID=UPI002417DB9C|nr:oligosaccharide flippase family protein [Solwaraspora sp. WMMD406]MDG4764778.1 oligosaccharide flippase family protein [Solwaraspora sp. WMMD406]